MSNKIIPVLALLLAAGPVTQQARAQGAAETPQLRLIQMTGEISVMNPGRPDEVSDRNMLPFITPGTEVRVLSGTALFQTDSQATLTATEGDGFLFSAQPRRGVTAPGMNIRAVGKETSLHLAFGGKRYLIREHGSVDIAYDAEDRTSVTVTGGYVALLPGTFLHAGESLTFSTSSVPGSTMRPGDRLTAWMPRDRGFDLLPVNVSSLIITRQDETTFVARTGRSDASGLTAAADDALDVIASWPIVSRLTAGFLIEKYGPPNEVSPADLTWVDNAPWKRTTVRKEGLLRSAPRRIVHQSIGFAVPQGKVSELDAMGMGLKADRGRKELTVSGESEEANFLALNLANDVINGRINVQDAKDAFARTLALSAAGKSSPYTEGLEFEPLDDAR